MDKVNRGVARVNRGVEKLKRLKAEWALVDDGEFFIVGNSLLQPAVSEGRPGDTEGTAE